MGFWLLILVLCHATNSIQSVNSPRNNAKLYKTFDEIFGEGWENEEKPKLSESNELQRMEASSTENRHENSHHNEQGGQNGSEESAVQTEHNELDGFDEGQEAADELFDLNDQNNQKNSERHKNKSIYSDDQKCEIVQEYINLKRQYCQKGTVSKKEWNQFNANAAKNLGVRYRTICMWQKQFGIDKKVTKQYSDDQKREFVKEYIALKHKFSQEKQHSKNEWDQFYANIFKELGVSRNPIFKWLKQFGVNKKIYTDEQKQQKVKEYYEIKLSNPKTKDTDIAVDLKISIQTLIRWKAQFKHSPEFFSL